MDLDLDNVLEVKEIRALISHKKNLLEFFNELIQLKNIMLEDEIYSSDTDSDSDYSTDELEDLDGAHQTTTTHYH